MINQFLGGSHYEKINTDIANPNKSGYIYEPLFNLGHEDNHHISFFFTALFSALILAFFVAINDYLDEILMERYKMKNNHRRRAIKLGIQIAIMFVLTLSLIYIFRILWGPVYL